MNLTKYLNQAEPTRKNTVVLNCLEYVNFGAVKIGTDLLNSIKILEYPEYNYVLKNGKGYLYSTDAHGNPKKPSVFYIENLNQISLKEDASNYTEFVNALPDGAKKILLEMEEESLMQFDYIQLESYLKSFNYFGFTFEYELSAEPFNFRQMTDTEIGEIEEVKHFENWLNSDNVVKVSEDKYKEQTTQYKKTFTYNEIKEFFKHEFIES